MENYEICVGGDSNPQPSDHKLDRQRRLIPLRYSVLHISMTQVQSKVYPVALKRFVNVFMQSVIH